MDDWIDFQIAEVEKSINARVQAEAVWRDSPEKSWRAVGCRLTKAERGIQADIEGRIAASCRRDLQMLKAIRDIPTAADEWERLGSTSSEYSLRLVEAVRARREAQG
jgi:hypothetical protein